MIFPSIPCTISSIAGHNEYGREYLGAERKARCCVVKLSGSTKKTSIRTDKSASQGDADEIVADARLLFPDGTNIEVGDVVVIRGRRLVVDSIEEKFQALTNKFDHYQVDLLIWR